jgi:putative flippase GtrA
VRTYIEFVVSRLFGTGVDTFVLWICSKFIFHDYWGIYVVSPVISFEFAVFSNFVCSYYWIWKERITNKNIKDFTYRFLIFNFSSVLGFLVKMLFLLLFQKIFGWNVVYCNLAALLISGLFNYFLAETIVFGKRSIVSKVSSR